MMNKKKLLPFALSTLALFLHGCGGESSKINEDPTKGTKITESASCDVLQPDCFEFALDYPVAGLNFDCSSDAVHHFITAEDSNAVTGACKVGDTVSFYLQGEDNSQKIDLGKVNLDDISKLKIQQTPRIRLIDLASGLTGKVPTSLDPNDETIRVTMALIKIFQSLGLAQQDNVIGDIQPIEITAEKKELLSEISQNIGVNELASGQYIEILKPWLTISPDLDAINANGDSQAFTLFKQLLNLSNTGVWEADLPIFKAGADGSTTDTEPDTTDGVRPDGFFGCNRSTYADCMKGSSSLLHSMGSFFLLTDRQGYTIGTGQQWRGNATILSDKVTVPYILTTKVKPQKMYVNAQNRWFDPLNRAVNMTQPLHLSLNDNVAEDILIHQGQLINGNVIPGTAAVYKQILQLKDKDDPVKSNALGLWKQTIGGEDYQGTIDILKVNPSSYLSKDIFKTAANVKSGQHYIFPLYATLNFKFKNTSVLPVGTEDVKLGIMIDEYGDIRTDIKPDATETDMSGICAATQSINSDGTITDTKGVKQYRIGTVSATSEANNDKSLAVRMILSNPQLKLLDGVTLGLNLTNGTGAKINIHNLLDGVPRATLTNFSNETAGWANDFAATQMVYINMYDKLNDKNKNDYVQPTDEERESAKRSSGGTVTLSIADACDPIKTKS